MTDPCPCSSGAALADCCGPILDGAPAPTPEALMRSRYSAFVLDRLDHVDRTHAPEARDGFDRAEAENMARNMQWVGLKIAATEGGGPKDDTGTVEFIARYRQDGTEQMHHEKSYFRRVQGQWAYVDGEFNPKAPPRRVEKVGRNDPCPCGAGKKYKKCHGA
jgi:SEC-C motif-containing protein